jgi:hypothetical protein
MLSAKGSLCAIPAAAAASARLDPLSGLEAKALANIARNDDLELGRNGDDVHQGLDR